MFSPLPPQSDNHDYSGHVLKDEGKEDVSGSVQFGQLLIYMGC